MTTEEKVKWPNIHCPQREQCMQSSRRWLVCNLRKEYVLEQIEKQRENNRKNMIIDEEQNNQGGMR